MRRFIYLMPVCALTIILGNHLCLGGGEMVTAADPQYAVISNRIREQWQEKLRTMSTQQLASSTSYQSYKTVADKTFGF